jgi:hypothetical protein
MLLLSLRPKAGDAPLIGQVPEEDAFHIFGQHPPRQSPYNQFTLSLAGILSQRGVKGNAPAREHIIDKPRAILYNGAP